jgi:DNA-binding MarR family transcriptional regulator/catechol 2,3-dioxygenase-like lactoylglutathione lyase family enzyme
VDTPEAGVEPRFSATPTLMRAARGAYASAIRAELRELGIDDLPRNAAFILTEIYDNADRPPDLPAGLGVSKQAVSQLIDTLVQRGYLDRSADAEDRRRISLQLTPRGREVVEATGRAVEEVDRQLCLRVSPGEVEAMRSGLRALAEIKTTSVATGRGLGRRVRQLRSFSPIFGVRDLPAALAHYRSLGFKTLAHEGGDDYGFANRDGTSIHLAADPHHDPTRAASTYLTVVDADALYAKWSGPGIGGVTHPVEPTSYGLREGSHVDPDGNTIRFGSPPGSDPSSDPED